MLINLLKLLPRLKQWQGSQKQAISGEVYNVKPKPNIE
jgi:hypothetical protein